MKTKLYIHEHHYKKTYSIFFLVKLPFKTNFSHTAHKLDDM